ncbi:diaminobutyrate acetyltransferase [Halospina denitrificans]|uniref:L-2,4-diaminobutyric acid acetyltransferase n=1 Tax=Halospina denitrificans TaxID=332522 RepID=A0A4R7K028_9GAMM|nr:diaminobutyrate acetyltransferase [Halospina denitrificans]TDT44160.1 diaminobutyrate acetyltransferase [Halospina denitrificans]
MSSETSRADAIELRQPRSTDGYRLHRLIAECPPLDPNSIYCNLLQCSHFAATGVAAELDGELVGFISAYIPPEKPEAVFVWQVAVHEKARGTGLAKRMLKAIVERPACRDVRFMETTITEDNDASWGLFMSFARDMQAETERSVFFEREAHFGGHHDSEILLRIGPFGKSSG